MRRDPPTIPPQSSRSGSGAAFALFGFVFCARAWLIKVWGSPVPYWDQWDAEALGLFRPWLNGTLTWADLFAAHNEHRIVLTRIADLALFVAGGNWNPWWQLLLNAALHATTAAALSRFFWNDIPRKLRPVWIVGLALLFIAPAGWQNALWGFQSQVYFCTLLSVLALGGLLFPQPLQPCWWLGFGAALLALFSLGSGVLAATTALVLNTLGAFTGYLTDRRSITATSVLSLFALMILVALGWSLRIEVPLHEPLHAHSVGQFGSVFFRCLSWPWVDSGWIWLFLQAPLVWLVAELFRRRTIPTPVERLLLGLGLLTMLHAAAVAYSRGAGLLESRPLSRYQDPLLIGATTNLCILLVYAAANRQGRIATLLWTGLMLTGLLTLTTTNLSFHLPFKRAHDQASLAQIRTYLADHDASVFPSAQKITMLHPNTTVVQSVLDDPQLGRVLPREFSDATVRPPWLIE